ncbi:MAG: enoyl-CoA hydratase-related protein [Pseudomonadales bacterium]|nr:enoyl-CoA hydratase-related protein [Pseudomonadales bacterium]
MSVSQQQEDPGVALDTGTDELLCRVVDGVALVTLNKPHKKNALGDELTPALRALLPVLEQDARVGCILLTGAGDAFCAGGDVSEMGQGNPSANPSAESPAPTSVEQRVATLTEKQMQLTHRLYHLKKITIAALPGAAAGAGLSIALACDLRVGSERAFITTAFRNIGLSGDYGASWFLSRLVGLGRAKALFYRADRLDAATCEAWGIFNAVFSEATFRADSLAYAKDIAQGPRQALTLMKANLQAGSEQDLSSSLALEAKHLIACSGTAESKEAIRAFMEKRPPNFGV